MDEGQTSWASIMTLTAFSENRSKRANTAKRRWRGQGSCGEAELLVVVKHGVCECICWYNKRAVREQTFSAGWVRLRGGGYCWAAVNVSGSVTMEKRGNQRLQTGGPQGGA